MAVRTAPLITATVKDRLTVNRSCKSLVRLEWPVSWFRASWQDRTEERWFVRLPGLLLVSAMFSFSRGGAHEVSSTSEENAHALERHRHRQTGTVARRIPGDRQGHGWAISLFLLASLTRHARARSPHRRVRWFQRGSVSPHHACTVPICLHHRLPHFSRSSQSTPLATTRTYARPCRRCSPMAAPGTMLPIFQSKAGLPRRSSSSRST